MMKRLIIAKTHYQVIFAIQMRKTIFVNDYVTLLVCDHSNKADIYANNIADLSIFDETHYVCTLGSNYRRSLFQRFEDFFNIAFCNNNRYINFIKPLSERFYDELLVFNYSMETYGIYSYLSAVNKNIMVSRFEEGILSYNGCIMLTFCRKIIGLCRRIQKKSVIEDHFRYFYCFYPELYNGNLAASYVPPIAVNGDTTEIIQRVFDVNIDMNDYRRKYIYFASVCDFEGEDPIGEYQVVCRIAEKVGKDNLLIKVHPRDRRTVYQDNGFFVDKNSSIPWEAIQLSGDFSDKVFLTATSGSVLAGSLMTDNLIETFYVYKLCNVENNTLAIKTVSDIERLLSEEAMQSATKSVHIAESIESII